MSTLTTNIRYVFDFNETSGNATDSVSSKVLSESGTCPDATGKIGSGRDMPGGLNWMQSVGGKQFFGPTNDTTISIWYNSDNVSATNTLMAVWGSAASQKMWRLLTKNKVRLQLTTNGVAIADTNLLGASDEVQVGVWNHLVWTWDETANQAEIFHNNASLGTLSPPGTGLQDAANYFSLGSFRAGTDSWDGKVDMLYVWDRVLTTDEISELYNSGDGLEYPFSTPSADDPTATIYGMML